MNNFKFDIGAEVKLSLSGEKGSVIGRAEYDTYPPSYLVRYLAADGRQCQDWFEGAALK